MEKKELLMGQVIIIAPTISALLGLEPIETYSGKILDFVIK